MPWYWSLLAVAAGYLIGSLSFAVIVSRAMGLTDPRTYGSKNPGATNVLRSGNRTAALLTLALDALKGWLPVIAATLLGFRPTTVALVGLAAFVGHLFPVFFHFRGGKGVATAAGVLLGLNPLLGAATLVTWAVIAFFFRYASLASVLSALFATLFQFLFWGGGAVGLAVAAMSALLVWRHAANLGKLLAGTESRIGQKDPHAASGHAAPPRR